MYLKAKFRFILAAFFAITLMVSFQPSSAANLMAGGMTNVAENIETKPVTKAFWWWWRLQPQPQPRPRPNPQPVPEINVYSGGAALIVILLGLLLIRERFNRS